MLQDKIKNFKPLDERLRKARLTTIINVLSQLLVILTGLISVPVILNYVSEDDFALWMVLTTILSFLTFSDLGLGIGLQDKLSKLLSVNNYEECRKIFLSSLLIVLFIMIVLIFIAFTIFNSLGLRSIYYAVIMVLALGVLSGVITRVFSALQEGFVVGVIQFIGRISSFFLLFVCVQYNLEFSVIVFIIGGLSYLYIILIGIIYLYNKNNFLFGNLRDNFSLLKVKDLMGIGGLGLGASLAIYLVNNTAPYVVSLNANSEIIVFFSIILKIITIPIMMINFLFIPLWPAITESYIKKDFLWLKKTVNKMRNYLFIFIVLFPLFIFIFYDYIINIWLHNIEVKYDYSFFLMVIFFMVLSFWNSYITTILNGLSRYKSQATYGVLIALLAFIMAIFLGNYFESYKISYVFIIFGYLVRCIFLQYEVIKVLGRI